MAEQLTPEHFLPHVDKTFRVAGGRHALTLAAVEAGPKQGAVPRQPFNLIFRGPPGDVLVEGVYTLEIESGPSFELYVMPIHTPDRTRQDYQSAFN
jgi:Domain of unknown function (DUF6916)